MPTGDNYFPQGNVQSSDVENREHEPQIFAHRITEIPSNQQMFADYGISIDGLPDYIGYAPRGLATSDQGWLLQKFTYDISRQCLLRQIAYDSWDNHTGATYA